MHSIRLAASAALLAMSLLAAAVPTRAQSPADGGQAPRAAKDSRDDRGDKGGGAGMSDDVGQGAHRARQGLQPGAYVGDKARAAVRAYYARRHAAGQDCPPGLAPRGSACESPSQPSRWQIGQPMPAGLATHALPQALRALLPRQPPGHQYVMVAGDILLIASRSRMVVDAVTGTKNP